MFNIGQVGQLTMGATVGAAVAIGVHGPGPLVLVLALAGSAAGGALWALVPGLLKFWRNIDVVISTLLLVYVADQILAYLVSTPALLQEPNPVSGESGALPQSQLIGAGVRLPAFGSASSGVTSGVVIALVLLAAGSVLLARSHWGLKLRMVGHNPVAARRFGVRVAAVGIGALVVSGALAGLAGGLMLTGSELRIQAGFENGYASDGLLAALVVRDNPVALVVVSFFFGLVRTGGNFLVSTGVPSYLYEVLQGLLVLAAVFPPVYLERRVWAQRLRTAHGALRRAG
jgi:simple sugar transport system permease protein